MGVTKPVYIIIDGVDGGGKGTQILKLKDYIYKKDKRYNNIIITREPTYIRKYGKKLRDILLKEKDPVSNAEKCFYYFFKDREEHIKEDVIPAIKKGYVVLQDRGKYCTTAYQGAQGADINKMVKKHNESKILKKVKPDIVIILDVDVEEGLKRVNKGRIVKEKFEDVEFLKKVRKHFLKMKEYFPDDNIAIIDGNKSLKGVWEDIKKLVEPLLPF